ncbi:MAG: YggS family pyridoxal phosphate-dependent enzyme [Ruminococcaceae bacterium]|nr:YggS family pyridoxal phosphate-dependent enzyme [Oscillospiraceae bacterium]
MKTIEQNVKEIIASLNGTGATLCAVTKFVDAERINCAIESGVCVIGENRAQELCEKYSRLSLEKTQVHFIGRLQTNKVKMIIDKVDMIESVDSERLMREIDRRAATVNKIMPILLEVNIGGEQAKGGIAPGELFELADMAARFENIKVCGIMTVIPKTGDKEKNKAYFAEMKKLFDKLKEKYEGITVLSMGMSEDYLEAIECGSTLIRVGRGIFGERPSFDREKQ